MRFVKMSSSRLKYRERRDKTRMPTCTLSMMYYTSAESSYFLAPLLSGSGPGKRNSGTREVAVGHV